MHKNNQLQNDLNEFLTLIANTADPNGAVVTVAEIIGQANKGDN